MVCLAVGLAVSVFGYLKRVIVTPAVYPPALDVQAAGVPAWLWVGGCAGVWSEVQSRRGGCSSPPCPQGGALPRARHLVPGHCPWQGHGREGTSHPRKAAPFGAFLGSRGSPGTSRGPSRPQPTPKKGTQPWASVAAQGPPPGTTAGRDTRARACRSAPFGGLSWFARVPRDLQGPQSPPVTPSHPHKRAPSPGHR